MSRLGIEVFRQFFDVLSPHQEKVSALLAHFPLFEKEKEIEPEIRLAEYLRVRARNRAMGLPDPEVLEVRIDEGTVVGRDADHDSSDTGDSGDSGDPVDGHGQKNERKYRGEKHGIGRDDRKRVQERSWRKLYRR